jgi:hypothetical protein
VVKKETNFFTELIMKVNRKSANNNQAAIGNCNIKK